MTLDANNISITQGLPEELRESAAALYEQAFGEKLALAIPSRDDRLRLLSQSLQLAFAIGARDGSRLVGLAGFSTPTGSLTGGISAREIRELLGWKKSIRALLVLALYERKARHGELLMDGIVVDADYRGQGLGTQLFSALIDYADSASFSSIRLDVIDTNSGARKLYERLGFREEKTERFEFLRGLLGFGASTTMIYQLNAPLDP